MRIACSRQCFSLAAARRSIAPRRPRRRAAPCPPRPRADVGRELVQYLARIRGWATPRSPRRSRASAATRATWGGQAALALSLMSRPRKRHPRAGGPVAKKDNGDRDARTMASFLQVVANERRRLKGRRRARARGCARKTRLHEAQRQRSRRPAAEAGRPQPTSRKPFRPTDSDTPDAQTRKASLLLVDDDPDLLRSSPSG